jgi:guanidinopropionase
MRSPPVRDPAELDIALIGVPFDGGAENRPGQRHGPREIRNMSSLMRAVHHVTRVNPYELCRVADLGDVPMANAFDLEASHNDIMEFYRKVHAAGAVPLSAGGDHSVSLPILRAIAAHRPVGLVHIDAHTDTRDEELGSRFTHGTPFRRAVEEGLLDPKRTVQIGIRGAQNSEEGWTFSLESGMRVIFIEEFTRLGVEAVIAEARRVAGDGATYVSFDVDSLDPAFAPGTDRRRRRRGITAIRPLGEHRTRRCHDDVRDTVHSGRGGRPRGSRRPVTGSATRVPQTEGYPWGYRRIDSHSWWRWPSLAWYQLRSGPNSGQELCCASWDST